MPTPFKDFVLTSAETYPHNPVQILYEFCTNFHLNEIHDHLQELLTNYLTSEQAIGQTPVERNNTICFCEQIWFNCQAIYQLRELDLLRNLETAHPPIQEP